MRFRVLFLILALAVLAAHAEDAKPAGAAPAWFLEEIAALTSGSGRWIADNGAYKSDQEPYEAYGMEWEASFDGTTMRGRLFGLKDGEETADFWEFRQYWHPARREAVVEQFGWGGTVGIGTMWREGNTTKTDQTFVGAEGNARRAGHEATFPDPDTHVTKSFDIVGDTWTPRRSYTWRRAVKTSAS